MTVKPEIAGTLSPSSPKVGDVLTATFTENVPGETIKLEWACSDNQGGTWEKASQDSSGAVFRRTLDKPGALAVTATLVRTFDKAAATTTLQTNVAAPPPPPSAMLVGWSMSNQPHPGVCGVARAYDPGSSDVDTAVNTHKVKRIALSSDDDTTSGATVVSRIQGVLRKYPDLEVDYAHNNEFDRQDHRGSSSNNYADLMRWAAEHKVIQDAIHAAFPADGSKGKVKTAIDGTSYAARDLGITGRALDELKRIGALPDVLAASMYPAGRKKTPPTESPMADHIDLWVDFAVKYGIKYVSCWEIGTGVSTNYDRPTLVAKWVKRLRDYSASKGIVARDFIYWDQEKAGSSIHNPFKYDGSTATVQGATQKALLAA
jgi:hypothetical protein